MFHLLAGGTHRMADAPLEEEDMMLDTLGRDLVPDIAQVLDPVVHPRVLVIVRQYQLCTGILFIYHCR